MLNMVSTFRQQNGLSAVGVSTPTLTGSFTVPAVGSAGTDAGTNHISGSPQTLDPAAQVKSTFGQSGGVFSYGILPDNYTTFGSAAFNAYPQPFYVSSSSKFTYYGGSPAYPNPNDGNHGSGYFGAAQGFNIFAVTPGTGSYMLGVVVASSNTATYTTSATAALNGAALLPTMPQPTFTEDGAGGGTVGLTIPAGLVETLVYISDIDPNSGSLKHEYTILTNASGAVQLPLGDNLGSAVPGGASVPSIGLASAPGAGDGDVYSISAVGFDYPAYEASVSTSQVPTIMGSNGQADLTVSKKYTNQY